VTDRTRLIVVSHVTSGAALRLPVADICRRAGELGIRTCVDGPHALAVVPLKLDELGCDFYAASCHKWLCGPIGTGFLYARPEVQHLIEPLVQSWGRVEPHQPSTWQDWFVWLGTRNPAESLALPVAMDFLEAVSLERFRARSHYLASLARKRLLELPGFSPITPDGETWYGPMVAVRVAYGDATALRDRLRKKHRIEMAVTQRDEDSLVRVSCHLYTQPADIERLAEALAEELR
jgi:isopenicillin-N epimerase